MSVTDIQIDIDHFTDFTDIQKASSTERSYQKIFSSPLFSVENDLEEEEEELKGKIKPVDFELRIEEAKSDYPQYADFYDFDHGLRVMNVPRSVIQESPDFEIKYGYLRSIMDYYLKDEFVHIEPEETKYNAKVSLQKRLDMYVHEEKDEDVEVGADEFDIDQEYIGDINEKFQEINAARKSIFIPGEFTPNDISSKSLDNRVMGNPLLPEYNFEFMVSFDCIDFTIGSREPVYASVALYDIETAEKLSETFWVEFNEDSDYLMAMIVSFVELEPDVETTIRRVLFSTSYKSSSIYLVVRIVRVFGVDFENNCDIYTKGDKLKDKDRIEFNKDIGQAITKYGKYRQAFAWGAAPIYDNQGNFLLRDNMTIPMTRQDKFISDAVLFESIGKNGSTGKALDGFIGISSIPMKKDEYHFENLYDESYLRIFDNREDNKGGKFIGELVKRIGDFSTYNTSSLVNYVNSLYVYPLNLELFGKVGKVKHVLLRAFVLESDEEPFAYDTLVRELIYGKSCSKKIVSTFDQTVNVSNKHPEFADEIKIKLPESAPEKLHILFVFYNIDDKAHKKGIQDIQIIEALLGYSVLRIMDDERKVINDGIHDRLFLIPPELEPGYVEEEAKTAQKPHGILKIRTKLVSNTLFQDPNLNQFFRTETDLTETVYNWINEADDFHVQQNFHHITNRLLKLLSRSSSPGYLFQALVSVLLRADILKNSFWKKSTRNHNINSFLNYHLQLPDRRGIYSIILRQWSEFLTNDTRDQAMYTLSHFSNYLFSIIIKSMKAELMENPDKPRSERFTRFKKDLPAFLTIVLTTLKKKTVSLTFNQEFALFLSDLLYFFDRSVVMQLIHQYIKKLTTTDINTTLRRKIDFLKIITAHEYYPNLIIPLPNQINSIKSYTRKFWKEHFLPGHILQELRKFVYDKDLSALGLEMIRTIFWKHALDERLTENPELMTWVGTAYFPIVPILLENFREIQTSNVSIRLEWIQCLTWVLKHTDKNVMRQWWMKETMHNIEIFLQLLVMVIPTYRKSSPAVMSEAGVVIVEVIQHISNDLEKKLWSEEHFKVFQLVIELYNDVLGIGEKDSTDACFLSFKTFVLRYSGPIFRYKSTPQFSALCSKVYKSILYLPHLREKASALIISCFLSNYYEMNEVSRMQFISTISVFKIIEHNDIETMDLVFSRILSYLEQREGLEELSKMVGNLFNSLRSFIATSIAIDRIEDPELKADMLYNLANQCAFSCELRVKMLERLSSYHETLGNYEEVAQCKLIIASMISSHMRENVELPYYPNIHQGAFDFIGPNVREENLLIGIDALQNEDPPEIFTKKGYEHIMREVSQAFIDGEMYEIGTESMMKLFEFYKFTGEYEKLSKILTEISDYSNKALELSKIRIFSNFYRVGFYGPKFGDLNGKEYIYKQGPMVRLTDFKERIENQFKEKIGEDLQILPNKHPDQLSIDPNKHYLQIIITESVPDEDRNRILVKSTPTWESAFGVRNFTVQFPYNPDGGPLTEDVDKQYIIKQTYETDKFFPCLSNRVEITNSTQILLGPLDCAIDLISQRVKELVEEANKIPPNTKTLQIKLQGSVMLQVQAGPKAIAHYFLNRENISNWDSDKIDALKSYLTEFIKQVRFGLLLNGKLIANDPALMDHQAAMIEAYNQFLLEVKPYGITGSTM
eukprot:TRINITY_DN10309_c0_g1_i1.p1 TRINITY_DN10309_c0_g1~~TRINITY_DN10309_c0_g1_i1.p1  ORF type:complete len:1665 (+),score=350.73 TRINITY_DN10309_c0_g1_i1:146-5140(+)